MYADKHPSYLHSIDLLSGGTGLLWKSSGFSPHCSFFSFYLAFSFQKLCRLSRLFSPHSNLQTAGTRFWFPRRTLKKQHPTFPLFAFAEGYNHELTSLFYILNLAFFRLYFLCSAFGFLSCMEVVRASFLGNQLCKHQNSAFALLKSLGILSSLFSPLQTW